MEHTACNERLFSLHRRVVWKNVQGTVTTYVCVQCSVRDVETMDAEELRAELRLARVKIAELVQENAALKHALGRAPPAGNVVCFNASSFYGDVDWLSLFNPTIFFSSHRTLRM